MHTAKGIGTCVALVRGSTHLHALLLLQRLPGEHIAIVHVLAAEQHLQRCKDARSFLSAGGSGGGGSGGGVVGGRQAWGKACGSLILRWQLL